MIIKKYPMKIGFDFPYEYSVDNGSTWVNKASGEYVDIAGEDLPANNRIKIRSNDSTATKITRQNTGIDKRLVSNVNLKQGQLLTDLSEAFRYIVADKLKIQRIPLVDNVAHLARNASLNVFDIDAMPSVTNAYAMLYQSNIKQVSNLYFGSPNRIDFSYLLSSLRAMQVGNIVINNMETVANKYKRFVHTAKIELFPNFDITYTGHSSDDVEYAFQYIKSKYLLSNKIKSVGTYNNLMSGQHGVAHTDILFSGLDVEYSCSNGSNLDYSFSYNNKLISPFSRLIYTSTGNSSNVDVDLMFQNSPLINKDKYKALESKYRYDIIENVDWLPDIIVLEEYTAKTGIFNGELSAFTNKIVRIDNGKKYVSKHIDRHDEYLSFEEPISHTYASDKVWFARNGNYVVVDGADTKVYLSNDTLVTTISGVIANKVSFSNDATSFALLSGDEIDKNSNVDQNLSQQLKIYSATDGSILRTTQITLLQNESIDGIYYTDIDNGISSLYTQYDIQGSVKISQSSKIVVKRIDQTEDITLVLDQPHETLAPNFAENAEFVAYNPGQNLVSRIFINK